MNVLEWVALLLGCLWYLGVTIILSILNRRGMARAEQDYMNEDIIDWDMRGRRPLPAADVRLTRVLYWSTVTMLGVFVMLFIVLETA